GDRISHVLPEPYHNTNTELSLTFENAIVFPGLINSHDHLDFNLFPSLGDKPYNNYTEWGRHIHKHYKNEISSVLGVPIALREQWGIYKNLLCGVTTVVNHGKKMSVSTNLITVYEDCHCVHSVQFEKRWKLALNNPLKRKIPVVIHTGEGTDGSSEKEIDKFIKWNLLKRPVIGVHGVAMNLTQARAFKALVWCPESNYFLLNRTAPINELKNAVAVLFGTDSTLTGNWNIWEHIRLARKTRLMTDKELYDTLSLNPAKTWEQNCGQITPGQYADLVVAKAKPGLNGADAFFAIDPKDILLVLHKGRVVLLDDGLYSRLKGLTMGEYSRIYIDGICKHVAGDLPSLMQKIRRYYPQADFPVI
ncbi:MAG: amidohydrolase family protein, partial [Mucilaginibacter sp.]